MGVDSSPGKIAGAVILLIFFAAMLPSYVVGIYHILSRATGPTYELSLIMIFLVVAGVINGFIKDLGGK